MERVSKVLVLLIHMKKSLEFDTFPGQKLHISPLKRIFWVCLLKLGLKVIMFAATFMLFTQYCLLLLSQTLYESEVVLCAIAQVCLHFL